MKCGNETHTGRRLLDTPHGPDVRERAALLAPKSAALRRLRNLPGGILQSHPLARPHAAGRLRGPRPTGAAPTSIPLATTARLSCAHTGRLGTHEERPPRANPADEPAAADGHHPGAEEAQR